MDIFLNTEIAARELDSNLLTALVAASRGHRAFVFDQRNLPILSKYVFGNSGVFHTKSLHGDEGMTRIHSQLKQRGILLTALDQEAGLLQKDYGQFAKTRFSGPNLLLADKVFCWGPRDFEFLAKNFPDFSNKFVVTGSSRVDLWQPHFSSISGFSAKDMKSPYILFSSNFTANSFYRHWEIHRGQMAGWPNSFDELEEEFFAELSDSVLLQGHYLKLLRQISKNFPDLKVVVRPHPTEDVAAWETLVENVPNVSVRTEGSLISWVHGASVVIQTGCTAALEATVAGRPVITFLPFSLRTETVEFALAFGAKENSIKGVLGRIRRILHGADAQEKLIADGRERLANRVKLDGFAAGVMVDEWEALSPSWRSAPPSVFRWVFFGRIANFVFSLRTFGRHRARGAFSLNKFPPLHIRHVRSRVDEFAKVLGVSNQYRIRKLYSRGIVIEPVGPRKKE